MSHINAEQTAEDFFLKVGKCQFCEQRLVVMDTERGSVLPVEVKDKNAKVSADEIYDGKKYRSHLLSCPQQQAAWEKKRIKYLKQRNPLFNIKQKDLLR